MSIALIDGDILVYTVGFASEKVSERQASSRLLRTLDTIINATQCSSYRLFLSDSRGNFRNSIFPLYKANRTAPKPVHYEHLSNEVVGSLAGEVAFGEEADDAIGICAGQYKDYTIVTIDKDLDQIPGLHFNWRKNTFNYVTEEEARRFFWYQCLVGDPGDNIVPAVGLSCPGIGHKKATEALRHVSTEEDYFRCTRDLFRAKCYSRNNDFCRDSSDVRLQITGQLVKIRRKPNEIWQPPQLDEE